MRITLKPTDTELFHKRTFSREVNVHQKNKTKIFSYCKRKKIINKSIFKKYMYLNKVTSYICQHNILKTDKNNL